MVALKVVNRKGNKGLSEFDSHHYHYEIQRLERFAINNLYSNSNNYNNNNSMIEECMRNTYEVLTEKQCIEDILEDEPTSMFYGNPFGIALEDIDEMINFFENTEEYEKCSELSDYRNLRDLDIFLENLRIKNGQTDYWV